MARVCGAVVLGGAALAALRPGGSSWLAAVLAGAGAVVFTLWRTLGGAVAGYGLLLAAASLTWKVPSAVPAMLSSLVTPLIVLEWYGLASVAAVALVRDPRRVSRRLLGSWLASSGLIVLGLSLCVSVPQRAAGSALVAAGLSWKLGTAPAYAWAPLLMRHPAPLINGLGVVASLAAGAMLLFALPRLPQVDAAGTTVAVLSAVTVPWALWHALRQLKKDRRCAASYAAVAAVSGLLFLLASRSRS